MLSAKIDEMRRDMKAPKAPRMTDPDLAKDAAKSNRPDVATPTGGPHRLTFIVPSPDKTKVNFGQKCPTHIDDVGITGQTDTHVHWHTQVAKPTLVTLGGPATSVGITSTDANLAKRIEGYGMFTDGQAWH